MTRRPLPKLRQIALSFPGAWEKVSHGEPTFWVGRRMFASYASATNHHGAGRNAVWCKADFVTQSLLLSEASGRYFIPPYVGSSGWIGIYLDGPIEWPAVTERLDHAHRLARGPAKSARRLVGESRQSARRRT